MSRQPLGTVTGRVTFGETEQLVARIARLEQANAELAEALIDAMIYAEDVLGNPEQLACFKKGVVQRHVKAARAAIAKARSEEGAQ